MENSTIPISEFCEESRWTFTCPICQSSSDTIEEPECGESVQCEICLESSEVTEDE